MRKKLADALQFLGALSLALAGWTLSPFLGCVTTAVALVGIGFVLERD